MNKKNTTGDIDKPLNILMILPYAPYPVYTGGVRRIHEKIKYFGKRHNLVVASFYSSLKDKNKILKTLTPYAREVILVKRIKPFKYLDKKLPYKIRQHMAIRMWIKLFMANLHYKFNIVMFEHIYVSPYRTLFSSGLTTIEEHNIESSILWQIYKNNKNNTDYDKSQAHLLENYESKVWPRFNLRTVVSELDKKEMEKRCNGHVLLVENGVNTQQFQPVEYNNNTRILYMGHMSYMPNIEAVKYMVNSIMPLLVEKIPGVELCIAGSEPDKEVLDLAKKDYVEIVADPVDMQEIASSCFVLVVPLFIGGGTRIKILEAMAMGLPVVTTSLGCEGLKVINRKHLVICDNESDFAEAIIEIKQDEKLRNSLRHNGRELVQEKYEWSDIYKRYEKFLYTQIFNK